MINFNPKPLTPSATSYLREKRGLSDQTIRQWEFCELEGYSFRSRLCFPIRGEAGEIVSIVGRSLLPDGEIKKMEIAKYWHLPYSKMMHLFGLHQAIETIYNDNLAILVEGQLDVIKLHQSGIANACGLSGKTVSEHQIELLSKYCDRIVLMLDSDVKEELITTTVEHLRTFGFQAFPFFFPTGMKMDPDLYCDQTPFESLREQIQECISSKEVNPLQSMLLRLEGIRL